MKEKKLARASLISTAFVMALAFIAFATLNGSLAWLAQSGNVSANQMSVTIKEAAGLDATVSSFGVIEIIKTDGVDTDYKFNTLEQSFILPKHDPNNISYDKYLKALVIRIEVVAKEATTVSAMIQATGGIPTAADSLTANFLSNAVTVTHANLAQGSLDTDETPTVIKASEVYSFTTVTADANGVKSVSKDYDIKILDNYTVNAGTTDFYFIMEYNLDFISYLNGELDKVDKISETVGYANDLHFVIETG